jgi:prophage tail gpP-like protein
MADKTIDLKALLAAREHVVAVIVNGQQIVGWTDYSISSSMVTPADSFTLRRPFDRDAWAACAPDSRIKVLVDGAAIVTGIIDARSKTGSGGTMEIRGRDHVGRLLQESTPRENYSGLTMHGLVESLARPWFTNVIFDGAQDRALRRGKGRHHASSGTEPVILKSLQSKYGKVEPGTFKWQLIQQICSQVGVLAWSSGDGANLILSKPNYTQGIQYVIRHTKQGSSFDSNCTEMTFGQDLSDCYAHILCVGSGGTTDEDYGRAYRAGWNHDGPEHDGTGRLFRLPKSLIMTEQAIRSNKEATDLAEREHARRLFKSETMSVTMPYHGQVSAGSRKTLFAVNTIARVIDEEIDYDENMIIHGVRFEASRDGEKTSLELVPVGTEIVQ